MAEIEGKICGNFRQAKNKREQIQIDSEVYCMSEDEIINILIKYGYDAEKYRKKKEILNTTRRKRKFDENLAMKLYTEGKNDTEIAKILKINRATFYNWRKQNSLETKNKKSRTVCRPFAT